MEKDLFNLWVPKEIKVGNAIINVLAIKDLALRHHDFFKKSAEEVFWGLLSECINKDYHG